MASSVVPDTKCVRVVLPDYVYHFPSLGRVKLAVVKQQIYHPALPTYRTMERDNVMHKLADEHCRTTTCCTAVDFAGASMNQLRPSTRTLHCRHITDTGRLISLMHNNLEDIQSCSAIWSRYKEKSALPVLRPRHRDLVKDQCNDNNLQFDGFAVSYFKSGIRNTRINLPKPM